MQSLDSVSEVFESKEGEMQGFVSALGLILASALGVIPFRVVVFAVGGITGLTVAGLSGE